MNEAMEKTLVLLKPDCVQRRLMGRIISRFEEKGLNIIAAKLLQVTPDLAKQHYAEVIRVVREMLGATNGLNAAAGTIRGDFSSSRQMNLVHASDGPEAAAREIELYFAANEICVYEPCLTPWMKASDE